MSSQTFLTCPEEPYLILSAFCCALAGKGILPLPVSQYLSEYGLERRHSRRKGQRIRVEQVHEMQIFLSNDSLSAAPWHALLKDNDGNHIPFAAVHHLSRNIELICINPIISKDQWSVQRSSKGWVT